MHVSCYNRTPQSGWLRKSGDLCLAILGQECNHKAPEVGVCGGSLLPRSACVDCIRR